MSRVPRHQQKKSAGFNVWFQSVAGEYAVAIGEIDGSDSWSVHSQASNGDLVLFYRTAPESCVADIFVVDGLVVHKEAGWKNREHNRRNDEGRSSALRKLKFRWFVTRSGNFQNWHFCVARIAALDG